MSRIDEALKRSSQGPVAARNINLAIDGTLKRADERTLDEYPVETRPLGEGTDRLERTERVLHRDGAERPAPAVPEYKAPTEQRGWPPRQIAAGNDKLMVGAQNHPMSLEQYRRLAATLHDAQVDKGLKAVVITSAVPKEGKTLTAVNLALTFSESYGRRVLLIDADLRRPSVHDVLGIPNTRGLSDVLAADRIELPTVDVSPLLAVLPSGHPDQSPLAGLSSERMRILLEEVASRYDWVILDTPPLGLLSDATLLTRLTQAAVFVIRAGSTPHAVIDRAITDLGREYVIGTVLNGVEEDAIPVKGYYGDYYGERR
jgi:capsular exopolysaccharide synthesis family protein